MLSFAGDVVSPGFFAEHLTSFLTVELPHDSAEGYMYELGINLQTLKYLQASNALDPETLAAVLEYMTSSE